jgi:hypothetical protein
MLRSKNSKIKKQKHKSIESEQRAGSMAQVVEYLPSHCNAPNLNHSTTKKGKRK